MRRSVGVAAALRQAVIGAAGQNLRPLPGAASLPAWGLPRGLAESAAIEAAASEAPMVQEGGEETDAELEALRGEVDRSTHGTCAMQMGAPPPCACMRVGGACDRDAMVVEWLCHGLAWAPPCALHACICAGVLAKFLPDRDMQDLLKASEATGRIRFGDLPATSKLVSARVPWCCAACRAAGAVVSCRACRGVRRSHDHHPLPLPAHQMESFAPSAGKLPGEPVYDLPSWLEHNYPQVRSGGQLRSLACVRARNPARMPGVYPGSCRSSAFPMRASERRISRSLPPKPIGFAPFGHPAHRNPVGWYTPAARPVTNTPLGVSYGTPDE
jgi:hypothetical protein